MAIITTVVNISQYTSNKVVLDYIKLMGSNSADRKRIFNLPLDSFEKYDLGNGVFALEQSYLTKKREDCFWETHRKYIDIQIHLDGIEQMELIDSSKLTIKEEYNIDKDLIVYEDNTNSNKIVMQPNDIAIYFPNDAHMGLPMYENKHSLVYKTVIKLPVEMWKS